MRLLDRYLFRELIAPLAYCLIGIQSFVIFFTVFNEFGEIQERKLHLWEAIEYAVLSTTGFLTVVLPVALLVALLVALTNHARYNEITAMRAAGISLWRICAPYFGVGLAASIALFAVNEFLAPRSAELANRILTRYVQKPGDTEMQKSFQGFASEHRQWQFGEYRPKIPEMINPIVLWKLSNGSFWQLHADRAVWTNNVWTFFNAVEYSQADTRSSLVPTLRTNVLAMPEFDETPSQIKSEMKINDFLSEGIVRNADIPLKDILSYLRLHPNPSRSISNKLLTELNGRLAAPWTCLIVVFMAIPFGVASGRRNLFVGVAGSIAICFSYFVIQKLGLALGSGGGLPAWIAAWLPNLIFGAIGLFLMLRIR